MGWQNTCENADDIAATLAALNTDIDISVLYRGLDPKNMRSLVSVVCIFGAQQKCLFFIIFEMQHFILQNLSCDG